MIIWHVSSLNLSMVQSSVSNKMKLERHFNMKAKPTHMHDFKTTGQPQIKC
jgi:hypothetical protein